MKIATNIHFRSRVAKRCHWLLDDVIWLFSQAIQEVNAVYQWKYKWKERYKIKYKKHIFIYDKLEEDNYILNTVRRTDFKY